MKKWIALLCFVLLIATLVILPKPTQADAGTEPVDKRSEALKQRMETMEEDETITVYIWFEDLDLGDVDAEAERLVGYTEKDIADANKAIPNFPRDVYESDPDFDRINAEYEKNTRAARTHVLEMYNHLRSTRNALVREAYAAYNQTNLETIELTLEELVYASYFSPMILANLTIEGIDRMQEIEEVLWLDYSEPQHPEPELEVAIPTVDADYVRDTEGYDGQGVIIGMINAGRIDMNHPELSNAAITYLANGVTTPVEDHSTSVARILVGTSGVAPNAQLIATSYDAYNSIQECIETVLAHDVTVINMSFGYSRGNTHYDALEKWVDHIAQQHHVTVVKSAGNGGIGSTVTSPGLAFNILTVGGINTQNTTNRNDDTMFNIDSTHGTSTGNGGTDGCAKPDFLAPAYFYDGNIEHRGTSFAAPIVSGIVAQMIQCNYVAHSTAITKAVLTASTTRKVAPGSSPGTAEVFEGNITAQQGAGVVNAKKAIMILKKGNYDSGTIGDGHVTLTFPVTSSDQYIRYALTWTKRNRFTTGDHLNSNNLTVAAPVNLRLRLFDSNISVLCMSDVENSSVELAHVSVNGVYGTYRARIYRMDSGTNLVAYAVAWR